MLRASQIALPVDEHQSLSLQAMVHEHTRKQVDDSVNSPTCSGYFSVNMNKWHARTQNINALFSGKHQVQNVMSA